LLLFGAFFLGFDAFLLRLGTFLLRLCAFLLIRGFALLFLQSPFFQLGFFQFLLALGFGAFLFLAALGFFLLFLLAQLFLELDVSSRGLGRFNLRRFHFRRRGRRDRLLLDFGHWFRRHGLWYYLRHRLGGLRRRGSLFHRLGQFLPQIDHNWTGDFFLPTETEYEEAEKHHVHQDCQCA